MPRSHGCFDKEFCFFFNGIKVGGSQSKLKLLYLCIKVESLFGKQQSKVPIFFFFFFEIMPMRIQNSCKASHNLTKKWLQL